MSGPAVRSTSVVLEKLIKAGMTKDEATTNKVVSVSCESLSRAELVRVIKQETILLGALVTMLEENEPTWSTDEFLWQVRDPLRATMQKTVQTLTGAV